MRKSARLVLLAVTFFIAAVNANAQSDIGDYKKYDFVPGEIVLLEDNLITDKTGAAPLMWNIEGGKATVSEENGEKYISINEYYTRLNPKLKKPLPDTFTIEYDTWLDASYDGNPGVEIILLNGDKQAVITPNKHALSVYYPTMDMKQKTTRKNILGRINSTTVGFIFPLRIYTGILLFTSTSISKLIYQIAGCNQKNFY